MNIQKEHESYGNMQINRTNSGGGKNFYGSVLKPINYITITIYESRWDVGSFGDINTYPKLKDKKIQIRMTETQFAKAITTLNHGEGSPITIEYFNGKYLETCPKQTNPVQTVIDTGVENIKNTKNTINSLSKDIKELGYKHIKSAKGRADLDKLLRDIIRPLDKTVDFYSDRVKETGDKLVTDIATETEAVLNQMTRNYNDKIAVNTLLKQNEITDKIIE